MTITTRLFTYFNGRFVGIDAYGNRYYTEKKPVTDRRTKRWVIYKGTAEPSKVPAEWHGWLHYTCDDPPAQANVSRYSWQKPHLPNLTGTVGAYVPPGHILAGAKRESTTADYQPWTPKL
jgi:NADH:ubiquinone oxidoreductase subunit